MELQTRLAKLKVGILGDPLVTLYEHMVNRAASIA